MARVDNTQKVVTILSIDGGGIRGVIPAYILGQLEALIREVDGKEDARIAEYFDIVAGTSTGSILTALVTAPDDNNQARPGHDASGFVQFYKNSGPKIFARPFSKEFFKRKLRSVIEVYGNMCKLVTDYNNSPTINLVYSYLKYYSVNTDTKNLQLEVDHHLKQVQLSQTVTNVVIPTFRLSKAMPVIFTTHMKEENKSGEIALRDAILSSAAAPLYFPPHMFKFSEKKEGRPKKEMFFDGGLGANNPSLAALCEATHKYGDEKGYSNYLVLSLGTGQTKLPGKSQCTSFSSWLVSRILSGLGIEFIMQTVNDTVEFQMSRFFYKNPRNYLRIQKYDLTEVEAEMCNGSTEHIKQLEKIATNLLSKEKVKVVDPYTGNMKDDQLGYSDALREFARKLVMEKRRRDKAKEKIAAKIPIK